MSIKMDLAAKGQSVFRSNAQYQLVLRKHQFVMALFECAIGLQITNVGRANEVGQSAHIPQSILKYLHKGGVSKYSVLTLFISW